MLQTDAMVHRTNLSNSYASTEHANNNNQTGVAFVMEVRSLGLIDTWSENMLHNVPFIRREQNNDKLDVLSDIRRRHL